MLENSSQAIANCFNMQQGTHVLYRDFGLNVIDENNPPLRRDCQLQIATYFPTVTLSMVSNISINSELQQGQFKYNVSLIGD